MSSQFRPSSEHGWHPGDGGGGKGGGEGEGEGPDWRPRRARAAAKTEVSRARRMLCGARVTPHS